jgi:tetratricopeptide (TPR) repeat protein
MRPDDRRTIWLFTGTALALGLLVFLAGAKPSAANWGVHVLGFLSPGGSAAVVLVLIASLLPPVQTLLVTTIVRWTEAVGSWSLMRRMILSAVCLCCLAVLFWLARQRIFVLGDGFLVIRTLGVLEQTGDVPGSFPTAPLSAMVAWQIMHLLQALHIEHAAVTSWQCVSVIAGLIGVAAIWRLTGMLLDNPVERTAGAVLIGAGGAAQLFFGYVETYPAAYAVLWIYVLSALRTERGETHLAVTTLLYLVLCLFHVGMVIIAPSIIYLWVRAWRREGWRALGMAAVPSLLITPVILWLLRYGVGRLVATAIRDGAHYLPVASLNPWTDPYTLFSVWHVADLMNLFLLLSPFSVFMLGTFLVSVALPRTARPDNAVLWFTLGLPAGVWLCLNSFELGLSRDWDLAAPFGMLFVLGALIIWHRVTLPGIGRQRVMILMALFTVALTGGWVALNASEDRLLARFDCLLDSRFWSGSALADAFEESGSLYRDRGQLEKAAELYARSVVLDSTNARRWVQLAGTTANTGDAVSASRAYDRALALGTSDPVAHLNAGILAFQLGRTAEGIAMVRESLGWDSTSAAATFTLGTMLLQDGRSDQEALRWLERTTQLDPAHEQARKLLAFCRSRIAAAGAHGRDARGK